MQDSLRSKWLGCSHVPSPSSPSRNLGNGGWISLNSSTSLVSTESPSVSSRIGKGKNQDHNRGIAVAPSGVTVAGLFGTPPTPLLSSNRQTAQRHSRRHRAAEREWLSGLKPDWFTEDFYTEKIQTKLASVTICTISIALGVSESYAADIRAGRHRPHPRHWEALTTLVGVSAEDQ